MTWNAPVPKVIHSISDSFLERSAPDVEGLLSGSIPFLERNLVISPLDLRLGFFCQNKTNMDQLIRYDMNSSTLNRSNSVQFSQELFTLYRVDFRTRPKVDPVQCEHMNID